VTGSHPSWTGEDAQRGIGELLPASAGPDTMQLRRAGFDPSLLHCVTRWSTLTRFRNFAWDFAPDRVKVDKFVTE
jgi:hypothetical protein